MIDTSKQQARLTRAAEALEAAGHKDEAGWLRQLRHLLGRAEASLTAMRPLIEAAEKGDRKGVDEAVATRRAAVRAEVEAEQRARAERKGRAP